MAWCAIHLFPTRKRWAVERVVQVLSSDWLSIAIATNLTADRTLLATRWWRWPLPCDVGRPENNDVGRGGSALPSICRWRWANHSIQRNQAALLMVTCRLQRRFGVYSWILMMLFFILWQFGCINEGIQATKPEVFKFHYRHPFFGEFFAIFLPHQPRCCSISLFLFGCYRLLLTIIRTIIIIMKRLLIDFQYPHLMLDFCLMVLGYMSQSQPRRTVALWGLGCRWHGLWGKGGSLWRTSYVRSWAVHESMRTDSYWLMLWL